MYQTNKEHRAKHNIPPIMTIGTEIWQVGWLNVLQTKESKIKSNRQHQLLPREQVWNIFGPSIDHHYRLTISRYNFYKHEDHSLTNCPFIEQDV
jgi:hypothetical protein